MRLTSLCTAAAMVPTSSDATASTYTIGRQSDANDTKLPAKIRSSAANAATLVAAAMNAVTGVGAPWYTSGVHMWNGTAATLKPRPTSSSATPASSKPCLPPGFDARYCAMPWCTLSPEPKPASDVVPVAPYVSAMP